MEDPYAGDIIGSQAVARGDATERSRFLIEDQDPRTGSADQELPRVETFDVGDPQPRPALETRYLPQTPVLDAQQSVIGFEPEPASRIDVRHQRPSAEVDAVRYSYPYILGASAFDLEQAEIGEPYRPVGEEFHGFCTMSAHNAFTRSAWLYGDVFDPPLRRDDQGLPVSGHPDIPQGILCQIHDPAH